ncbi:MAG TPA: penicillin acylase family protein [Bryobacteraceae bacterium]|jgi:acyl-homoserine-lactone acylase
MRGILLALLLAYTCRAAVRAEILWDRYGVPHIFAANREQMFYAHGWAQMRNQADLLLHLYGESRGRGAEYWGEANRELDRWIQLNDVPERARVWYLAQAPEFRKYLDAFARGINDYAKANPASISPENRVVLPVSGIDVVQHSLRVVHYMYMGSRERMQREVGALLRESGSSKVLVSPENRDLRPGSNTWSIGPAHSSSGKAMLLINPHLQWGNTFYRYMEVHLTCPDYDLYGAPQVGFPVPVVGFNPAAGWGRTVNTIDTVDFYKLTVRDGQYLIDGKPHSFERESKSLKVRLPDGSFRTEKLEIRRSLYGPVVYNDHGVTIAMKVAGLDRPKMLEQWFRMGEARNLAQFQAALRMMAIPMWNANYADRDGHIMLTFDGLVPRRQIGDYRFWAKVVPGDTSKTLWAGYLSFDELPKSTDPPSGWEQNTNEPPWTMTFPQLDRRRFPDFVAPAGDTQPQMRTLRSLRMITEDKRISYEKLLADKFSTRMELADRILPDLLKAGGNSTEALRVLAKWDRQTETDSRGAVLFQIFVEQYFGGPAGIPAGIPSQLRIKYDPSRPLDTAFGLADTATALKVLNNSAEYCRRIFGSLDVKWGDVFRFSSGTGDVPANGGPGSSGVFRTIDFTRREGKLLYATHGDTFVCAIEFATPQRAECTLGYGNASQPNSSHLADQLPLMQQKKLHPVWRGRKEIEANLEKREQL